jgi:hypothetical protein
VSKCFRLACLVILVLLPLASLLQAASWSEDLFQKAVFMESVERNLEGAIAAYEQVIDQAGNQPALEGEARLRLGICLEKLGKTEHAQKVYRQLLSSTAGVSSGVIQQARTNLRNLEAQARTRVIIINSPANPQTPIPPPKPTRLSLLMGTGLLLSDKGTPALMLSPGLRIRTSAEDRSPAWFVETRVNFPAAGSTVAHQANLFDSQGLDQASLSLRYQASLGLVAEWPHKEERVLVPEVGAGFIWTASKIEATNRTSASTDYTTTWSPYLKAGLHLFPARRVSLLFETSYVTAAYPKSIAFTSSPAHSQTFDFPSSMWSLGVTVQLKIYHRAAKR